MSSASPTTSAPLADRRVARRLIGVVVSLPLIGVVLVVAALPGGVFQSHPALGQAAEGILRAALMSAAVFLVVVRGLRFSPEELGLAAPSRESVRSALLVGVTAIAIAVASSAAAVVVGGASLRLAPAPLGDALAVVARTVGGVGFEELAFRSCWMALLWPLLHRHVIVVVASVPFALLHAGNDGATLIGIANAYLLTLSIGVAFFSRPVADDAAPRRGPDFWPAFAFHLGWNATLAVVGSAVSGESRATLFVLEGGDATWTGGAFGLEASAATTIFGVLGLVVVEGLARARARSASAR